MKYFVLPLALILVGCISKVPLVQQERVITVPLLENVAKRGQTYKKGERFRLLELETGEKIVVLWRGVRQEMIILSVEHTDAVEIDDNGCTTGRVGWLWGSDADMVSIEEARSGKTGFTPNSFCFDVSVLD